MEATKVRPPEETIKQSPRFSRWPAFVFGSCLSSLPSKYVDISEISHSLPETPTLNPQTLTIEQATLHSLSVQEIIDEFFNIDSLVSDANAVIIVPPGPLPAPIPCTHDMLRQCHAQCGAAALACQVACNVPAIPPSCPGDNTTYVPSECTDEMVRCQAKCQAACIFEYTNPPPRPITDDNGDDDDDNPPPPPPPPPVDDDDGYEVDDPNPNPTPYPYPYPYPYNYPYPYPYPYPYAYPNPYPNPTPQPSPAPEGTQYDDYGDYGDGYDFYDDYYYYCTVEEEKAPDKIIKRIADAPPVPAREMDVRYRDRCVATADLEQGDFDKKTGQVADDKIVSIDNPIFDEYYDDVIEVKNDGYYDVGPPEAKAPFQIATTGYVSGAKPLKGTCMAMRDSTIKPTTEYNKNSIFGSYMTLNGDQYHIAYTPNGYIDLTSIYDTGGTLGCPQVMLEEALENLEPKRGQTGAYALRNYLHADYCYNYFILQRAKFPWYFIEVPEPGGTDDPMSSVDAHRTYLANCQPFINGTDAQFIIYEGSKDKQANDKAFGWAPVLHYHDMPHWNEHEYWLKTYLAKAWQKYMVYWKGAKDESNEYKDIDMPCIEKRPGLTPDSDGGGPNDKCVIKKPPKEEKKKCSDLGGFSASRPSYEAPQILEKKWCGNVETINDPTNPWSPRQDISGIDRNMSQRTAKYYCVEWDESGGDEDKRPCDNGCQDDGTPNPGSKCTACRWGYLGNKEKGPKVVWKIDKKDEDIYHVTCGVVPVDILSFRSASFNQCMGERIDFNVLEWKKQGAKDMVASETDPANVPWNKCKTRFFENDTVEDCPVYMSVQQCCRIIVKDLVPANNLKIRTCEGKRMRIRKDKKMQALLGGKLGYGDDIDSISGEYTDEEAIYNPYHLDDPPVFSGRPDMEHAIRVHRRMQEISCSDQHAVDDLQFIKQPWTDHLPYMRWWDTGVAAANPFHGGQFTNTLPAWDVIVGVGREERDKADAHFTSIAARDYGLKERAKRLKQPQEAEVSRIGDWAAFKAYLVRSIELLNQRCINVYERSFKQGGAENFAEYKSGGGVTSRDGRQWPWSRGWRAYNTARHPKNVAKAGATGEGGNHVLPGDIISFPLNGIVHTYYVTDIGFDIDKSRGKAVFDFGIGKFRLASTNEILLPSRIYVMSWDQGKYPTSADVSITWGQGPEKTIYMNEVPKYYQSSICGKTFSALTDAAKLKADRTVEEIKNQCRDQFNDAFQENGRCMEYNCQPSCEDTDLSACVLPATGGDLGWNHIKILRPSVDVRPCLDGKITGEPPDKPEDQKFDMQKTYDWKASIALGGSDPKVIYQGLTQTVDSDLWGYCVNAGYDPPPHYAREYKGPQAGALTDNTLCGPKWGSCSSAGTKTRYFPRDNGAMDDRLTAGGVVPRR